MDLEYKDSQCPKMPQAKIFFLGAQIQPKSAHHSMITIYGDAIVW